MMLSFLDISKGRGGMIKQLKTDGIHLLPIKPSLIRWGERHVI